MQSLVIRAGKNFKNKFKHKNLYNSAFAYGIKSHRHICEIDQELEKYANQKSNIHSTHIYYRLSEVY